MPLGCSLFNDDEPPNPAAGQDDDDAATGAGADEDGEESCVEAFEALVAAEACPSPTVPELIADLGDQTILLVDDPANATTIGPQGWLFGTVTTADYVGFMIQDDGACEVACVMPAGHPCGNPDNFYCQAPSVIDESCTFCGPMMTASECGDLIESCAGGSGGDDGGADTTGGADSTGEDGGLDETGEEAGMSIPVELFESNPDATYGTTTYVLEQLGDAAPPNLIAHGVCATWDPRQAVGDWFGEPVFQRSALTDIFADAELVLRECDHLRLQLKNNGIELTHVEPSTLAYELGFRADDIITDMNGVSATDPALLVEALLDVTQQPGSAEVGYIRAGVASSMRINIQ